MRSLVGSLHRLPKSWQYLIDYVIISYQRSATLSTSSELRCLLLAYVHIYIYVYICTHFLTGVPKHPTKQRDLAKQLPLCKVCSLASPSISRQPAMAWAQIHSYWGVRMEVMVTTMGTHVSFMFRGYFKVISPIFLGIKTFTFHGFGVQG